MKMFSTLLAMLLVLTLGSVALAQDDEDDVVKDFMEVGLSMGGAFPMSGISDWTTTNEDTGLEELGTDMGYNILVDVGHFLTANLVVGFSGSYSNHGVKSDSSAVQSMHHQVISPAAYFKYYFSGESNLMPYIKGTAGVDVYKFATRVYDPNLQGGGYEYRELAYDPAFAFSLGGGLFYYTHDFGGLYLEGTYRMSLTKDAVGSYEGRDYTFGENGSMIDLRAGIKVFFGSD